MKGQSMAVETIFTVGLGLAIATGTITLFEDYRSQVQEDATEKKGMIAVSKIASGLQAVESSEYARKEIELPQELAGASYSIKLEDTRVEASNSVTSFSTNVTGIGKRNDLSGTASGGKVFLSKNGDDIVLRGT
ncbi:MAG: hypothetical protein ABEJ03_01670 [Candidatus Nanohaloarchaea archaeon]